MPSSSNQRTRLHLTNKQKARIFQHHQQTPSIALEELAQWARASLKTESLPSISSLSRLLHKGVDDTLLAVQPDMKTLRPVTCEKLDNDLAQWIDECEEFGLRVSYACIQAYARQLSEKYEEASRLSFSSGWLTKFLKRHNLGRKHVFGEASSIDPAVVEEGRNLMQSITQFYEPRDIYNLDETGYFYCQDARHTIAKKSIHGRRARRG
ncbi:hypothetical protein AC1031_022117 [Aphanomyces cochlioides]|nr:hypothetical protein AC1031_022117 [Aphanomyces cochlioides]